ncbi:MAG: HEAT repeat domain-containing protein [Coriobacteriales bacterium]|jgi:HEAT repeat protein
MSTIDYAQVNPRVGGFINPFKLNDPKYRDAYTKLARSCAYPAGYENGLFNTLVGVVVCIAGLVCLGVGLESSMRYAALGAGIVIGIIVAFFYGRYMQVKALFPRGACAMLGTGKSSLPLLVVPSILYIALPVACYFAKSPVYQYLALGAVCALIEQFAFAKSNGRNVLTVTAFLLFIVPFIAAQLIGMSDDVFANIMSVLPYQGVVFVCTGVYLTRKAVSVVPQTHDRELIRFLLSSDNLSRKYLGLSYLSASLDSDMIPDLAKCMHHENYVIACTAQIAFGNVWGPKPNELTLPMNFGASSRLPDAYREQFQERINENRKKTLERWTKHHTLIEEKVAELAAQNDEAVEDIFSLAEGKKVLRHHARITAIEMLGSMRTPRAYATLMTLLQHTDKSVARAAEAGFFGADSKAILYLEKFFVAPAAWQRARAIRATRCLLDYLEIFDSNEANLAKALLEPDIDGLLDTPDTCTFAETITLLPAESREDIGILEEYLGNDRPIIRIAALRSLIRQCPDSAHDYLVTALNDESAVVRYAAVLCVADLLPEDAGTLISTMLSDPNPRVAACADRIAGRLNSSARANAW